MASNIRKDVLDITGCTASAGIANNMLMARIATRIAKPNGQCYIPLEQVYILPELYMYTYAYTIIFSLYAG